MLSSNWRHMIPFEWPRKTLVEYRPYFQFVPTLKRSLYTSFQGRNLGPLADAEGSILMPAVHDRFATADDDDAANSSSGVDAGLLRLLVSPLVKSVLTPSSGT